MMNKTLYRYINSVFRIGWLPVLAFIICLPAMWPLFSDQFFHMHDFTHVARLSEMYRALQDGHFPVRWSQNFGFGYGMPLFNFYGPLPYYLGSLFMFFGFGPIEAFKVVIGLTFIVSFVGMYLLVSRLLNNTAGLVSATAFIYLPYRSVDLYVRGAINELMALSLIPLYWYFMVCLVKEESRKWISFSGIALGAIMLSHNLVTMMVIPITILFSLVLLFNQSKKRKYIASRLLLSFVFGIGLAAFYTMPSYLEKDMTRIDTLKEGYSHYSHHFLYFRQLWHSEWDYGGSIAGIEDDMSFEIGKPHLIIAAVGLILILLYRHKLKRKDFILIGFLWFMLFSLAFMTAYKSQIIWNIVPPLHFMQFPWRLLSLIIVIVSMLVGYTIYLISKNSKFIGVFAGTVAMIIIFFWYKPVFVPNKFLEDNQTLYYTDEERIRSDMSGILPDFIHPDVPEFPSPAEHRFELEKKGDEGIEVVANKTHEFEVRVNTIEPDQLLINIFDFPGWKFYVNGEETIYSLGDDMPTIKIMIDPGNESGYSSFLISGKLYESSIRQTSNIISLISLILLFSIVIRYNRKIYAKE